MLNPSLNFPHYWEIFARTGRVQMQNFLQPEVAEQLHDCLTSQIEWSVALRNSKGISGTLGDVRLPESDSPSYRELIAQASRDAKGRYGFIYESYMMVRAYREGRDPGNLLHRVLEYMNSAPFLDFCRAVSDDKSIRRVSAQATRFREGMFLRTHNDQDSTEGRVVAYVINLSRDWHADWGGLLQFLEKGGGVSETFLPRFNSLSLFRVPADHCVSIVSPWAERPRLAITGWWETLAGVETMHKTQSDAGCRR
ncbi:MAG: 2OG-Fe(II) oxygenase [Pseudomonadota bacterium]|nr:2OG-Fe(II) oxygenase [Pseudomonadota bacterium]